MPGATRSERPRALKRRPQAPNSERDPGAGAPFLLTPGGLAKVPRFCSTKVPNSSKEPLLIIFNSTHPYISPGELSMAVDAAVKLERPLLVKGEPGTGKTLLAEEIANTLGLELSQWHIKSTTKAQQGLYEYDAVTRLRDSQLGDARVKDIRNYLKKGKLWDAFASPERPVLLIDEIDKADIEFPNDLLQELDRMEFFVYETG